MFRSLRARLVVLLALALLPAVVLAIVQALDTHNQAAGLAERNVLRLAAVAASEEENAIVAARQTLELLASLPALRSPSLASCGAALDRVKASAEKYGNLAIIDLDGTVVCSTAPGQTPSFAQAAWFRQTLENDSFTVSAGIVQRLTEEPIFLATLPLRDQDGETSGIIGLSLRQSWLQDLILRTDVSPETNIALLDRAGNVIAEDRRQDVSSSWLPRPAIYSDWLNSTANVFQHDGRDGIARVFAVTPIYEDQVFVILAGLPGQLMQDRQMRLLAGIGYPLLMWAIAVAVAWLAVDRLVLRSILTLRETAQAYSRGDFENRVANIDAAPEELRDLGLTLHSMADAIALHEGELRRGLDEQKTLLAEVYHRVKNNLQVMSSLLNLQISRSEGDAEKAALRLTQNRIHALSMVHSSLYEAEGLHSLCFDQFLPQLCRYLFQARASDAEKLRLTFDIDPVRSEPDQAIPLALLVTEVLSSLFTRIDWQQEPPAGASRSISVVLKDHPAEGAFSLTILGQMFSLSPKVPNDLSEKLVLSFAKQLRATLKTDEDEGFRLELDVPG